jgi:hypothetical protein
MIERQGSETELQAQIMADNAALRAQLATVQAERIKGDAQAFVTSQIAAGHVYPAEAETLTALYCNLAQVTPAEGQPSAVALLTATIEARPSNRLAGSLLPSAVPPGAVALGNQGGDQSILDEAEASARAYAAQANGRGAK